MLEILIAVGFITIFSIFMAHLHPGIGSDFMFKKKKK